MLKIIINNNKTLLLFGSLVLLSGCSTIDGFIGGGLNAPESVETIEPQELSIDGNMTPSSEPELIEPVKTFQTTEELMKEKDNALVEQGMRLATAEKELMASNEEKNILQQELEQVKKEVADKQAELDQQNNIQVNNIAPASNAPRAIAPNGGYGLHVASYQRRENIALGLAAIGRQIPVLIEDRPVKVANVTVRGRTYLRLIIGQFNLQSEAIAECNQAKLLIDFCDVVAFEGEDF
jgi:hypothetical protein